MSKKSGLADSPFFSNSPQTPERHTAVVYSNEKTERKTERTENRTPPLPDKRRTKRYSYEFFEDQIMAVKRLKYEADMAGERVSQSDFVRDALDRYLEHLKNK